MVLDNKKYMKKLFQFLALVFVIGLIVVVPQIIERNHSQTQKDNPEEVESSSYYDEDTLDNILAIKQIIERGSPQKVEFLNSYPDEDTSKHNNDAGEDGNVIIPGGEWITVMNPEDQESVQRFLNGKSNLQYRDSCITKIGGEITVIGVEGGRALVEYQAPGTPMGTACPSGVMFFVLKEDLAEMAVEYERICTEREEEKALVKRLLE